MFFYSNIDVINIYIYMLPISYLDNIINISYTFDDISTRQTNTLSETVV